MLAWRKNVRNALMMVLCQLCSIFYEIYEAKTACFSSMLLFLLQEVPPPRTLPTISWVKRCSTGSTKCSLQHLEGKMSQLSSWILTKIQIETLFFPIPLILWSCLETANWKCQFEYVKRKLCWWDLSFDTVFFVFLPVFHLGFCLFSLSSSHYMSSPLCHLLLIPSIPSVKIIFSSAFSLCHLWNTQHGNPSDCLHLLPLVFSLSRVRFFVCGITAAHIELIAVVLLSWGFWSEERCVKFPDIWDFWVIQTDS